MTGFPAAPGASERRRIRGSWGDRDRAGTYRGGCGARAVLTAVAQDFRAVHRPGDTGLRLLWWVVRASTVLLRR